MRKSSKNVHSNGPFPWTNADSNVSGFNTGKNFRNGWLGSGCWSASRFTSKNDTQDISTSFDPITHYVIGGEDYPRVPFGPEEEKKRLGKALSRFFSTIVPVAEHCRHCGVEQGQLHEIGCDLEICPKCHKQGLSCSCEA